jgi:predicted porin
MKKTLIALAVLAASGASFAQVTATGNLTYGYQATTNGGNIINNNNSSDTAGFGADTARVIFTAKEDLGSGYAAKAVLSVNTGPQAASSGDDHSLTLTTPVGGLVLGTAKAADYLSGGIASVGAYYAGWDSTSNTVGNLNAGQGDKLFTNRTKRDYVALVVPVGAFTFALTAADAAGDVAIGSGTTGLAAGTSFGSTAPVTTLSATYAAGPLVANGQYAVYKNNQTNNAAKDTTRLAGSYDLGMVKLGAGVVVTNQVAVTPGQSNPKTTDFLVAAKAPFGQSHLGLTYASRTVADAVTGLAQTSSTGTGYSLEYGYDLSKRTSVIANYARWTPVGGAGVVTNQDASTQYQLLLSHSF